MMRGKLIGKRIPATTFSPFSTASNGGGSGRGRGRGGSATPFNFVKESPDTQPPAQGRGSPLPDSFSSFLSAIGRGQSEPIPHQPIGEPRDRAPEARLRDSIISVLGGAGRGVPTQGGRESVPVQEENRHMRAKPRDVPVVEENPNMQDALREEAPIVEENRHVRDKPRRNVEVRDAGEKPVTRPKVDPEEAKRRAMEILSRTSEEGRDGGGRGRGMMSGRGRGGRGRGRGRSENEDEEEEDRLLLGDNADGEKLASKLGPENMNKLTECFEDVCSRVLPSPMDDAVVEAFDTNCMIEFEPEYLVEFDNPDIDEKPPMSLREALEKAKPFLMAYEGIQSQEEWEQVVDALMEHVPLLKEIVDHYSGPDRVTAKQQHEELERVAKTIPEKAPASVKNFADRAILSLQSNPGWGWDKKCQFMDKFVAEVSQHYK